MQAVQRSDRELWLASLTIIIVTFCYLLVVGSLEPGPSSQPALWSCTRDHWIYPDVAHRNPVLNPQAQSKRALGTHV